MEPHSPIPFRARRQRQRQEQEGRGQGRGQGRARGAQSQSSVRPHRSSPSTTPLRRQVHSQSQARRPLADSDEREHAEEGDVVEVPCSPYITQPTQVVATTALQKNQRSQRTQPTQPAPPNFKLQPRGTQPTQIVNPWVLANKSHQSTRGRDSFLDQVGSLKLSPPRDLVGSSFLQDSPTQLTKPAPIHTTQPTQIMPKETQTKLSNSRTHRVTRGRLHSSDSESDIADTDSEGSPDIIEVPVSSPFRPKKSPFFDSNRVPSRTRPAPKVSLAMAPAGTSFRPPKAAVTNRTRPSPHKLADLSEDESTVGSTMKPFSLVSSDEDELPARGDIRPSSFVRKFTNQSMHSTRRDKDSHEDQAIPTSSEGSSPQLGKRKRSDFYLGDVKSFEDINGPLRALARKVLKLAGGDFTPAQCLNALLDASHNVKKAVKLLEHEEQQASSDEDDSSIEFITSQPTTKPTTAKGLPSKGVGVIKTLKATTRATMEIHIPVKQKADKEEDPDSNVDRRPKVSRLAAKRKQLESLRNKRQQRRGISISAGSQTSSPEDVASYRSYNSPSDSSTHPASRPPSIAPSTMRRGASTHHHSVPALDNNHTNLNPNNHTNGDTISSAPSSRPGRRLVRRFQHNSTTTSQPKRLTDLVSSDSEPEAEESETVISDLEDSQDHYTEIVDEMNATDAEVLGFLNNAIVVDILAFVNKPEADIKHFLESQPFENISAAENVSIQRYRGRGLKRLKVDAPLGIEIVQAIWPTVTSIKATNVLVKKGGTRIGRIEAIINTWNRDHTGRYKEKAGMQEPDTDDEDFAKTQTTGIVITSGDDTDSDVEITSSQSSPKDNSKQGGYAYATDDGDDDVGSEMANDDTDHQGSEKGFDSEPSNDDEYLEYPKDCGDDKDEEDIEKAGGRCDLSAFRRGRVDQVTGLKDLPFQTPKMLKGHCTMKRHQKYGMNYLALLRSMNIPALLADDMGLGKTCTVISLIACLAENDCLGARGDQRWPNLIVVPPSTLNNWRKEFARFAPNVRVAEYRDASRADLGHELRVHPTRYHVVLTSYTQIGNNNSIDPLRRIAFNMAVFDEGHQHLKNKLTFEWSRLMSLSTKWKLILSGTPVQNNFQELISILAFLDPKTFTEKMYNALNPAFRRQGSMVHISKGTLLAGARADKARDMLAPYMLQRRKEDLVLNLPPKIHRIIYCGMTASQAAVHNSVVEQKAAGKDKKAANPYMRLKQAGSHSLVVRQHFSDKMISAMADKLEDRVEPYKRALILNELTAANDYNIQHHFCNAYTRLVGKFGFSGTRQLDCGKTQTLMRLLLEFKKEGSKALVFTPLKETTALLYDTALIHGINACYMAGDTPVATRQELIDDFNASSGPVVYDAFILTTGTGGAGVNLTSASKVIIYDMSDNPQDDVQAENRAHRIGQKKTVEVIRLITKGSIEETIFAATKRKIEMADKVTNWQGLRELPNIQSEDGRLDDLIDVSQNEVQKKFVQMCARMEGTVKYDESMDDGIFQVDEDDTDEDDDVSGDDEEEL